MGKSLLFLFGLLAAFSAVVVVEESKKLDALGEYQRVDLEILSIAVESHRMFTGGTQSNRLVVSVRDHTNGRTSNAVVVRHGRMSFSLLSIPGKAFMSTWDDDMRKYPVGTRLTGYAAPDLSGYVLER